jgi:hypothetical protein
MNYKMEYLSLYDYLGKPAGQELGLEVATAARQAGVEQKTREVSNPKYTGIVHLYPKDFLESYFREPDSIHMEDLPEKHDWMGNLSDDDLPF